MNLAEINKSNLGLRAKYGFTAWWYDILDYPWESLYRYWRPELVADLKGDVLEAGVGTGRNLPYYPESIHLTAIDLSPAMLRYATKRSANAKCRITLLEEDATLLSSFPSNSFDWIFSTFMCCVMPNSLQPSAIKQFERVLRPNGKFRLLELVYSRLGWTRTLQKLVAPLVEKVYGARFDRDTLSFIDHSDYLIVEKTYFLKKDTYMVIEGRKIAIE